MSDEACPWDERAEEVAMEIRQTCADYQAALGSRRPIPPKEYFAELMSAFAAAECDRVLEKLDDLCAEQWQLHSGHSLKVVWTKIIHLRASLHRAGGEGT